MPTEESSTHSLIVKSHCYSHDSFIQVKRFVVWYFEDGAPKRYYSDFVARLTNGAHIVIETKGQKDKSAQIKRKALQGWVKAVNSMGTWGKWFEVLSTHPADLEGWLAGTIK